MVVDDGSGDAFGELKFIKSTQGELTVDGEFIYNYNYYGTIDEVSCPWVNGTFELDGT